MIYLSLFLTFLEIGAFSFGGGYGMISLIRERALANGWLGEEELLNMIAVAESTPGPIAVNMATFVGASEGGILGALLATLGVVFPSFIIILIIAAVIRGLLRFGCVGAALNGVRPAVVGLILSVGVTMLLGNLFGPSAMGEAVVAEYRGIAIFLLIAAVSYLIKRVRGRAPSPILLILISAGLGLVLYGAIPA